jgi:tetratricopeptide (TPR) repeat protein
MDLAFVHTFQPANYDLALAHATTAVALRPDSAAAHLRRGVIQGNQGAFDDAETEYRTAIRLQPGNGAAHARLALLLRYQAKKFDEAIAEYRICKQLQTDRINIHREGLAFLLTELKRYDEAAVEYQEWTDSAPNDPRAWLKYGSLLKLQNNIPKALQLFKRGLTVVKPDSPIRKQLDEAIAEVLKLR